jgi:hypothetical protein
MCCTEHCKNKREQKAVGPTYEWKTNIKPFMEDGLEEGDWENRVLCKLPKEIKLGYGKSVP